MKTHGGKGSTPRPVNKETYDANWDRIFGNTITVDQIDIVRGQLSGDDVDFKWLGTLRGAVIHGKTISQESKKRFERLCEQEIRFAGDKRTFKGV